MSKDIKLSKSTMKKLSKSWIGIVLIIGLLGYNFYQSNKTIEPGKRYEVTLNECVDGDTAWFNVEGKRTKVRFLYIDTPESTNEVEPYGQEASDFTKDKLTNAKKIELEMNKDGDQYDKYDRLLAWVFYDNHLLQTELAKNGLVEKFYDYGYEYTYAKVIIKANNQAKENKVGIYS